MPTIEERIDEKRKEVRLDRHQVERWKQVEDNRETRIETIEELLDDVLSKQSRKNRILKDLEDGYRHGTESHGHGDREQGRKWEESKIERAQERLADDLDQLARIENRLVDRLDVLAIKEDRAADRVEKWVNEKDHDLKRLKYLRRRRKKLEAQSDKISDYFYVWEFDCNNGTPVPQAAIPALEHLCTTYLDRLRERYGVIVINSGYRTASYNASIGGASNSVHIYDQHPDAVAADHWARSASPNTVYLFDNSLHPGGLGKYATFTHIDNRQLLGWAVARWSA